MKRGNYIEDLQNKCENSLLYFTMVMYEHMTGKPFEVNWHHEVIFAALEEVLRGDITRLIINIPPRYSKTESMIHFIAWTFGIFPYCEYIHASYGAKLAVNNSKSIRAILEDDLYRAIFPGVSIRKDSRAMHHWKTDQGGQFYAVGSGGAITGFGAGSKSEGYAGAIFIDDAHKVDDVDTITGIGRLKVLDWYIKSIQSRVNRRDVPIVVMGQRLHVEDLPGFLLARGDWHHLCIPAIGDKYQCLWPLMHTREDLNKIYTEDFIYFSCQYMQNPIPAGGGLFKQAWWKYYTDVPSFQYKFITGDTAQKTNERNDYSVFQCWGYTPGSIYLLDQIRGKWESPELRRNFIRFWNRHCSSIHQVTGRLRCAYIEDSSSGTGLIQDIRGNEGIPIYPIKRNKDKVTRFKDVLPYICAGHVYIPKHAPWLNEFLHEFLQFTDAMTHKHDDQIDPLADAIMVALASGRKMAGLLGRVSAIRQLNTEGVP